MTDLLVGDAKTKVLEHSSVDFIVPTLKRPDHLQRCLAAIEKQSIAASSVLVGIRVDDVQSPDVIRRFGNRLVIEQVEALGVGVVGSMNSCLRQSQSEYVVLLDDDVEIPPRWTETMLDHLRRDAKAVAAGGRDLLMDDPEMRQAEPLVANVGRIHWYGRITGNHHRGGGKVRAVNVLRGSNCMYRGRFLREVGFESGLRGKGAQVNWELALAFQARNRRLHMLFDPQLGVPHHVAPRHDNDSIHRGKFDSQAIADISFNESFVCRKHCTPNQQLPLLAWQFLIGSFVCPGLLRLPQVALRSPSMIWSRMKSVASGRYDAMRAKL